MECKLNNNEIKSGIDSFILIDNNKKLNYEIITHNEIYEEDALFGPIIKSLKLTPTNPSIRNSQYILSDLLCKNSITKTVLQKIVSEGISNFPGLRGLIWKILLNYLPNINIKSWKDILLTKRLDYENLVDDTREIDTEETKVIKKQIEKDIYRTKTEEPFFHNQCPGNLKEIHLDRIKRILLVYSINHPSISYIQGMNELVAVIYYAFSQDSNSFLQPLIESDVYYCFELFMNEIKSLYELHKSFDDLLLTKKINLIKDVLEQQDKELLNHLNEEGIPLHTFTFRWLLLFFAQELSLNEILRIWDSLLTQNNKINFTCFMTCAILIIKRKRLLEEPFEDIMLTLQRFNLKDKIDIDYLVKLAMEIRFNYKHSLKLLKKN